MKNQKTGKMQYTYTEFKISVSWWLFDHQIIQLQTLFKISRIMHYHYGPLGGLFKYQRSSEIHDRCLRRMLRCCHCHSFFFFLSFLASWPPRWGKMKNIGVSWNKYNVRKFEFLELFIHKYIGVLFKPTVIAIPILANWQLGPFY